MYNLKKEKSYHQLNAVLVAFDGSYSYIRSQISCSGINCQQVYSHFMCFGKIRCLKLQDLLVSQSFCFLFGYASLHQFRLAGGLLFQIRR